MPRTGFFTAAPAIETNYIRVGGEAFHALAVALLDNLKTHRTTNDVLIKQLTERTFHYYPQFKPQQSNFTPAEQLNMFLRDAGKSKAVECLAFVLRQFVVDEIYAKPLNYREVFDGLNKTTPQYYLRQPDTVLPASVFAALATTLTIHIALSYTEHGKELRMLKLYADDINENSKVSHKIKLHIQIQQDQYFPEVKHATDYTYVGHLAVAPPAPELHGEDSNATVEQMLHLITEDNKRLLQTYVKWKKNLLTMLDSKEISLKELIDFYIEFLSKPTSMLTDTTAFFAKLTQAIKNPVTAEDLTALNSQFKELLTSALAGWISVGKVNADQLIERKEVLVQNFKIN